MARKVRRTLLTVLFITGAAHCPLLAQSPQATISGIITDSTGAVVPEVQVTAINLSFAKTRLTCIFNNFARHSPNHYFPNQNSHLA